MALHRRVAIAFVLGLLLALPQQGRAGLGYVAQFGGDPVTVDTSTALIYGNGRADETVLGGSVRGAVATCVDTNFTTFAWRTAFASATTFDIQDNGVDDSTVDIGTSTDGTAAISVAILDDRMINVQWSGGTNPGFVQVFVYGTEQ